ncbi:hypothetical protein [Methylopila sp. M107]|uniref:hypothetical protein n=1 Tax=Methylopila sp. M107 TaxID=1101190 RepID=UPI0012DD6037|nr:hypothetical protein [Methylopila sp. M107]
MALEVQPQSIERLKLLIDAFKALHEAKSPTGARYSALRDRAPLLHFMSMSVFTSADYDPVFVIEANFDGPPGPFWAQLEAAASGPAHDDCLLRLMLRCCKRPADGGGPLYDAVTAHDSRQPLAAYFELKSIRPSVFHHGNRGLERNVILQEGELFLATRKALAQPDPLSPNPYRGQPAEGVHAMLRQALLPGHAWLAAPAPARFPALERAVDILRLVAFVFAALFALSIPGIAVALIADSWLRFLLLFTVLGIVLVMAIWRVRAPYEGLGAPAPSGGLDPSSLSRKNSVASLANPITLAVVVVVALVVYVALVSTVGALATAALSDGAFRDFWEPSVRNVSLGLFAAIVFALPAVVLWLRLLERRDAFHDAPAVDPELLSGMALREDRVAQNHMGSLTHVKPGVLRMGLFLTGHLGLHLLLRVVATDGYLGSMRTVHFAHWAFVDNGSRLMFFSNFDHSWSSYLDDFIEKAHGGLTLAWGSCVGFPPTRFLVLDGASHGRKFKQWARHSMTISRFWYSAYEDFTVDQIERHHRIAEGLRKPRLSAKEAVLWARDL